MMNLLALLALTFAPVKVDPPDCSLFTAGGVNPPAATPCPPPGVMDWACVLEADDKYKKEVAAAQRKHCQTTNAIVPELSVTLSNCRVTYAACVDSGTAESVCMSDMNACYYDAKMDAIAELETADATLVNETAIAAAAHAARTVGCCRQE